MYPHLTTIIKIIIMDNYGSLARRPNTWEWPTSEVDLDLLEKQASKFSTSEKEVLAAGEDSEQKALVRKYKAKKLNDFLCEVFDGNYTSNFMPDLM